MLPSFQTVLKSLLGVLVVACGVLGGLEVPSQDHYSYIFLFILNSVCLCGFVHESAVPIVVSRGRVQSPRARVRVFVSHLMWVLEP